MSKTSTQAKTRWNTENYKRLSIYIDKEDAERYIAKCAAEGKTLSDIPKQAILNFINQNS
nr:MAG TPA: plasmid partition protein ParG-helix-helix, dimer, DNA binding, CELL [Bacteriophage sp.]